MKKTFISLFFCFALTVTHAQKKAVTETGDEVFLYDDGTWKYANGSETGTAEIAVNPAKYIKPASSTFLLKSVKLNVGFWLDSKKWSFKKGTNNPDAEFEVQLKDNDLYGMIITEKVEVPLESLRNIALDNGKAAAPDLKVVKEEYRNVNGLKVLLLQMSGTAQGIKFTYYGYYFSNTKGTVQFITYTSTNLIDQYISTCEELLNGLVEIK